MVEYHVYPGGKKRILTFSYDDGPANDTRLVSLFNKYGVKGTFHLNGKKYLNYTDAELEQVRTLYKGHEISAHTLNHGWLARMPMQSVVTEVYEDRKILEKLAGYPVTGMSYPSGSFNNDAITAMKACGIVYSRTTLSTMNFHLPEDFMRWHPSCHHRDALTLAQKFIDSIDSVWTHPLFYIWGHSFEFSTEESWEYIENVLRMLSGNEKIWYATNIEIYNYFMAQKSLVISADETIFRNPSAIDVWVERNKNEIIKVPAGQTIIA